MITNWFFVLLGLSLSIYIILKTRKHKLLEKESFVWLLSIVPMVIVGIFPGIVDKAALLLHISYGPSLLFLVSILLLTAMLLRHSVIISSQQTRINELGHRNALMEEEIRRLRNERQE